ncbi:MAG TPA: hypothetical protein VNM66_04670, partial [Thermodesulfobacteriota bacterium]|nr:hypothetical protein [Thermodesulfobacteriota bacterium]
PPPGPAGPAPAPPPAAAARVLVLDGEAVREPFRLEVEREPRREGDRYVFRIEARGWEVDVRLDTAALGGVAPTEAPLLTSDWQVEGGGLALRTLVVRGIRLGTTGTADGAFDRCAEVRPDGDDEPEGDDEDEIEPGRDNRQGLMSGRLTRLDAVAAGEFVVTGTDERCTRVSGTIAFSAPVD